MNGEMGEPEPTREEVKEAPETGLEIEEALSPETIKEIMKKVQDINESGIAFSGLGALSNDNLASLFKNGLLGDNWRDQVFTQGSKKQIRYKEMPSGEQVKSWASKTKSDKNTMVHFHITGRMDESKIWEEHREDIEKEGEFTHQSMLIKSQIDLAGWTYFRRNGITLLFNLSGFKEFKEGEKLKSRIKTFRSDSHGNEDDPDKPEAEYGFVGYHRIPPRNFTGVVMRLDKPIPEYTDAYMKAYLCGYDDPEDPKQQEEASKQNVSQELIDNNRKRLLGNPPPIKDEKNPERINARVSEVVKVMQEAYRDKPEMMVPVYNRAGDLLWPKQISHKELVNPIQQGSEEEKNR